MEELANDPNSYLVQSPMCRFGMKLKNDEGELLHVRKETLWLTNSEEIAKELKGVCENDLKGREVHRHVHLVGANWAKAAQVYPVALVEAVLRGLKRELEKMNVISAVEEQVSGPSPDDMVSWEAEMEEYKDDASGATLDPKLVQEARAEELRWIHQESVYVSPNGRM